MRQQKIKLNYKIITENENLVSSHFGVEYPNGRYNPFTAFTDYNTVVSKEGESLKITLLTSYLAEIQDSLKEMKLLITKSYTTYDLVTKVTSSEEHTEEVNFLDLSYEIEAQRISFLIA